tara:strand:+ start:120 stop:500 length:381 start_codon:yes stop_codon:yes gene_type:complete
MGSILTTVYATSTDVTTLTTRVTTIENATKETARTAVNFAASPYAVLATDTYLEVDTTNGNVDIEMRAAASGRYIRVTKVDASANQVIIIADGSETLDGDASLTLSLRYATVAFHPSTAKYIIEAD